jgi:hypothetical protein
MYEAPEPAKITEGMQEDEHQYENNEEEYLVEPFDITREAPSMTTGDHPNQDLALRAALLRTMFEERLEFQHQQIREQPLKTLSRMYDAATRHDSIPNMTHRRRIRWRSSEYVVPSTNQDIHWQVNDFYLDLLICRGQEVGIAALLPNLNVHHAIEFRLELKSAKFAHLAFNPFGAMQFIGRTHRGEDVWIAWIPNEAVGEHFDDQDAVPPGTCSGNTILSPRHFNGAFMYLANELHHMHIRAIMVWDEYPELDDMNAVQLATNAW